MSNSDAVATALRAADASVEASSPVPTTSGVVSVSGGLVRELSRGLTFTDGQLGLLLSAGLFVIGAWPLALTEVPPYQDLPNHLAAVTVIGNADRYPELVFNGFFKTNAALFAWLYFVGKVTGLSLASRLFSLTVLAANAFVLPRFVLALTGSRKRMVVASLFCWPLVHNWFVSMGMLDFALAVPLSLGLLLTIDAHRKKASWRTALLVSVLGAATWYAHVFPLLVVHMLVFIEAVRQPSWRARIGALRAMAIPLLPVTALVTMALFEHFRDHVGPMTAFVHHKKLAPPWELLYNLWAEYFWGFTKLSITSIVPCFVLVYLAFKQRREAPAFFSPIALVALVVLYCFTPYKITNWYHVNSRLIPFIWLALILRVPDQLPRRLVAVLGVSAVLYSAGMGADFARLERDRERFTAGVSSVPEGAQLLPLIFKQKGTSENTRSILHAWGFYVTAKHTSAPLLFAHSRSFPVMYRTPPPVRFNQLLLENFATSMKSVQTFCESLPPMSVADCQTEYRARWAEFWAEATPRYDHLLLWEPTPDALALVPPSYSVAFRQSGLVVMAREGAAHTPTAARY
ncbi:MAG: hypothetical protein KF819_12935 [Labilithrix sp.]|nr:hypothetical protein [Labilithrix sp.]